jgi:hypothetical protein
MVETYSPATALPQLFLRLTLGACLLLGSTSAWAQDNNNEVIAKAPSDSPANIEAAGVSGSRTVIRPFSPLESMNYESSISAQLRELVGRYLNPKLFHINVEISGRVISPAGGTASDPLKIDAEVTGKPIDNDFIEEDKTLEMLPALPFFSSRLRAPIKVDATEQVAKSDAKNNPSGAREPGQLYGPTIDRISVFLMVDTSVTASSVDFYQELIKSAVRLDQLRGDQVVVKTNAFPRNDTQENTPTVNVSASLESDQRSNEALMSVLNEIGGNLANIIGLGLGLLGILVFVGLVWRGRKGKAAERDIRTLADNSMPEQQLQYNPGLVQGGSIQLNAEMTAPVDPQQEELKASDPLMDWLLNDRVSLAFVLERWYREQGDVAQQKAISLLYPYGIQFFEMFSEHLEPKTAHAFDLAWHRWSPEKFDSAAHMRSLDELKLAMKNQKQFGNFPFVLYLKDEEILHLLQDEDGLDCLMVLEGITAHRRSRILQLLGAEKTSLILSAYTELSGLKFDAYAELSSRLFKKLKTQRERNSTRNLAAYDSVLKAIEGQSIEQQDVMIENLNKTNPDLYTYVRERVILWSDVIELESSLLQEALNGMESEQIAAMLQGNTALQERILPLRPAREQVLIRDQMSHISATDELTQQICFDFLTKVRRLKGSMLPLNATA